MNKNINAHYIEVETFQEEDGKWYCTVSCGWEKQYTEEIESYSDVSIIVESFLQMLDIRNDLNETNKKVV